MPWQQPILHRRFRQYALRRVRFVAHRTTGKREQPETDQSIRWRLWGGRHDNRDRTEDREAIQARVLPSPRAGLGPAIARAHLPAGIEMTRSCQSLSLSRRGSCLTQREELRFPDAGADGAHIDADDRYRSYGSRWGLGRHPQPAGKLSALFRSLEDSRDTAPSPWPCQPDELHRERAQPGAEHVHRKSELPMRCNAPASPEECRAV